jgi:hypothetical protein
MELRRPIALGEIILTSSASLMPNAGRNMDHERKLLRKLTKSNAKLNEGRRVERAAGVICGSIVHKRPG